MSLVVRGLWSLVIQCRCCELLRAVVVVRCRWMEDRWEAFWAAFCNPQPRDWSFCWMSEWVPDQSGRPKINAPQFLNLTQEIRNYFNLQQPTTSNQPDISLFIVNKALHKVLLIDYSNSFHLKVGVSLTLTKSLHLAFPPWQIQKYVLLSSPVTIMSFVINFYIKKLQSNPLATNVGTCKSLWNCKYIKFHGGTKTWWWCL